MKLHSLKMSSEVMKNRKEPYNAHKSPMCPTVYML